ncbi:MAG: amidohydrolase family protein [Clostridiales Family XIII bacterium]|jgi:imidazolonepropionase-like amidohydrolase|nr:amidohydrolase family protein [Clostridiales Family XIII bacterium]
MRTLVKTGTLFTADGAVIERGWFTIENGRIGAVGRPGEADGMDGLGETLDYGDCFVMPGLIDAHQHFSISHGDRTDPLTVMEQLKQTPPRKVAKAILYLRQHVDAGETAARSMGEDDFLDFELKRAIDEGYVVGPRISPCGAFLSPTHGHGQTGQTVSDGVEGMRKNARVNLAKGADLLKVFGSGGVVTGQVGLGFCTSTREELRVAVEEAEMLGKYVAAHVHGGPGIDLCMDVGVRSLEHATMATDAQIERMAKLGVWVTATFSPMAHPDGLRGLDPVKQARLESVKHTYDQVVAKLLESGVKLCAGTDGVHGALWFEAACLERCGASREQALRIITVEGARSCRMEDRIGSIAPGRHADFIALEKSPLEDLGNLRAPKAVYIGGRRVPAM